MTRAVRAIVAIATLAAATACGGTSRNADPEAAQQHFDEARRLYGAGDLQGALQTTARALVAGPDRDEAYALASRIFVEQGNDEDAVQFFEITSRNFADRPEPWFYLGYHRFRLSRWAEALEAFERAGELDPADPASHFRRGLIHQAMGDFDAALTHLRRAHELAPEDPVTAARLARVLRITGDYDEAGRVVREALARSPDSPDLHYAMGQLHLRASRDDEAERSLSRAIELDRFHREARYDLARLLLRTGREERGRRERMRADRLSDYVESRDGLLRQTAGSRDPEVALRLAELDLTERNTGEALRWLAASERAGGPAGRIAAARAEAYCMRGDLAAAAAELARLGGATDLRAELARASCELAGGEPARALSRLGPALAGAPAERTLLRRAADLYEAAGRTAEADALLERAAATPAGTPSAGMTTSIPSG